jgi:hypothetical protein
VVLFALGFIMWGLGVVLRHRGSTRRLQGLVDEF